MKNEYSIYSLALLFFLHTLTPILAQPIQQVVQETKPKESLWKGFKRYDFKLKEKEARLIIPNKALAGNPWIWRARFPDWHTEADSILVSEGYHLAYINTDNKYGSPEAVSIWDGFYNFLTTTHKLHKKVALMGISRGGLFIYNWAKQNPEKVASIYAEAPVCDFKSWPAGFGESVGSPEDWTKLKKEYGLISDKESRLYANNPIDALESLAAYKIPILHMVGLKDKIVPYEENTMLLVNKYISLGGIATVIPCTSGVQKLEGHHFTIESPRKVADFIKYYSPKAAVLSSSIFHEVKSGFRNSQMQFEEKKKGRVAFLGGSITYNSGWRDSIASYLRTRFPLTKFEFINAGIPSMGSTPAAFRLKRDVLSKGKIDLLFEEAAVNDAANGRTPQEQIRAMEGIIRHLKKSNPAMDIVMMHFVDPDKMADYNNDIVPEVIVNHNKVAKHYLIPTINLAQEVTARIKNGEFNWERDFKDLHPSPFGQGIYAHSVSEFLNAAFVAATTDEDKKSLELPQKIDLNAYDNGYLLNISDAKFKRGWKVSTSWSPNDGTGTRPNYTEVPMLIGNIPSKSLYLKFEGKAVGIAVASGKDAGMVEYRIDKGEWTTLNLFTKWSKHLHLPWYYTLATGLETKLHLLEIRIAELSDENSTGNVCRIRYFYINKH